MDKLINTHWQWLENQIQLIRAYSGITHCLTMNSTLIEDVHIDSLEMLELISSIEQYTKLPLSDDIWMKWNRLRDIVDYLVKTNE